MRDNYDFTDGKKNLYNDKDDVQELVDEIRASQMISTRTLSDMDQAVVNLKDGFVSPAIDLSGSD